MLSTSSAGPSVGARVRFGSPETDTHVSGKSACHPNPEESAHRPHRGLVPKAAIQLRSTESTLSTHHSECIESGFRSQQDQGPLCHQNGIGGDQASCERLGLERVFGGIQLPWRRPSMLRSFPHSTRPKCFFRDSALCGFRCRISIRDRKSWLARRTLPEAGLRFALQNALLHKATVRLY
jgi:hypothetical protein